MFMYVCVYIYVCMCIYTHICICMYKCIYIYIERERCMYVVSYHIRHDIWSRSGAPAPQLAAARTGMLALAMHRYYE